jgi:hypothetical protein
MASIHDRHRQAATSVRRESRDGTTVAFPAHDGLVRIGVRAAAAGVELELHEEAHGKVIDDFIAIQLSAHQAIDLIQHLLAELERSAFEGCPSESSTGP